MIAEGGHVMRVFRPGGQDGHLKAAIRCVDVDMPACKPALNMYEFRRSVTL